MGFYIHLYPVFCHLDFSGLACKNLLLASKCLYSRRLKLEYLYVVSSRIVIIYDLLFCRMFVTTVHHHSFVDCVLSIPC